MKERRWKRRRKGQRVFKRRGIWAEMRGSQGVDVGLVMSGEPLSIRFWVLMSMEGQVDRAMRNAGSEGVDGEVPACIPKNFGSKEAGARDVMCAFVTDHYHTMQMGYFPFMFEQWDRNFEQNPFPP